MGDQVFHRLHRRFGKMLGVLVLVAGASGNALSAEPPLTPQVDE
jgi:hypothetical protein